MEQETLFTSSKWDILKCLESGKKSPIDLAKETNTSVANISQQLRLLELAGFVISERISNREKGLPRILYSLAGNYSYLVLSSPGYVGKRFSQLEDYQKTILKIWFIDDKSLHYYIEKYFWSIEQHFEKANFIAIDYSNPMELCVKVVSSNPDAKKSFKDIIIEGPYGNKQFRISFLKELDPKGKYVVLYAPDMDYTKKNKRVDAK